MIISERPFAGSDFFARLPRTDGYHDVTWLSRNNERGITALSRVSSGLQKFLDGIDAMLFELRYAPAHILEPMGLKGGDLRRYTLGTAYCRTMPAQATVSGVFHYDTGLSEPTHNLNSGATILRFVGGASTDGRLVATVFSSEPRHHGLLVHEASGEREALIQPPNDHVIMFSEGSDLHGRAPAPDRPDARTVFLSASLYKADQAPNLSCSALAPLRHER